MKKSSNDRKKIEAFEDAMRKKEYGNLEFRRRYGLQKIAFVIIALFILLLLIAMITSFI